MKDAVSEEPPSLPDSYTAVTSSEIPAGALVAALLVSGLVAAGGMLSQPALLALGAAGALALGFLQPNALLLLTLVWVPFTDSLSGGERRGGFLLAFSVSDVLLFAAMPGLVWQVWQRFHREKKRTEQAQNRAEQGAEGQNGRETNRAEKDSKAGQALPLQSHRVGGAHRLGLAVGLYLAAGLLSFLVNLPAMGGEWLSIFIGFARTVQIVLLLPLCFAAVEWRENALRWLCAGALMAVGALALASVVGFRTEGAYRIVVMGNHKNVAGLAVATGALIALAVLTQPGLHWTKAARFALMGLAALCSVAVGMLMARGSVLCLAAGVFALGWMRRRPLLCVGPALLAAAALFVAFSLSPRYVKNDLIGTTQQNPSVRGRSQQFEKSWQVIRSHPILGDGFQTRRDAHPHNVVLTVLAENGIVGFLLFGWVLVAQAQFFGQARKTFSENPTFAALCVALMACNVAVLVHAQFDPFWRRGPLWIPWAGTGIILSIQAFGYSGAKSKEPAMSKVFH